ncbi:MAG TPA: TetR family transcriptional regulator C-terminal domain-containing protein [Dongiaceae bacterium]|nr:TetR family transcriptional regulator C-terminal domain-containing protein [Dongiaceae bacterium]
MSAAPRKKRRTLGINPAIRENRRRELIEAAIHVIARHGRAGCTVGRVAREAQLSQGLMNFHFRSMDLLLAATFDHLAEEFDRVWRARVAKAGPAPWERLEAMIEAYFTAEVFSAEKLAVWFSFWVDADLRDQFRSASVKVERRYHREIEPEIVRLLEAAQTGDTAKEAARFTGMLTAMVDGYWLQALLYPKTFRAKAAVTACLDFLRLAVERTAA